MPETTPLIPETPAPSARGTLPGHGGVTLAWARWDAPAPVGRVVLSHGFGEHGERYAHTAAWLNRLGWSVSALDHRGFGRSTGARGDAEGIRGFVEDLTGFLHQERLVDRGTGLGDLPLILLGHSFGGLVAALALLWHSDALDGLILSSPAVALRPRTKPMRMLGRLLLGIAPHFTFELPNHKENVCSDPILVQRYWADPLCHRHISAAFGEVFEEGRRELLPMGRHLDRPILLLEAGNDTVVDPDASEALWEAIPQGLLERHRLPGFRHEVFHDQRRAEAQAHCEPWLAARAAARTPSRNPQTPASIPA
jgi:alpha-beta hydrolase superfamily lysophospholipase